MQSFIGFLILVVVTIYFPAIGFTLLGVMFLIAIASRIKLRSAKASYWKAIERTANIHSEALARNRVKKLKEDDYGDINVRPWFNEVRRFYKRKIVSSVSTGSYDHTELISIDEVFEIIDRIALNAEDSLVNSSSGNTSDVGYFESTMSGIDYEFYCAKLLREAGWDAQVSQASGDQGVDIIAKMGSTSVAVQCKKYSSAVGNKAVQEVTAGKVFYDANHAVVITNSTYTASAYDLAEKTNVFLTHHEEISSLASKIGLDDPIKEVGFPQVSLNQAEPVTGYAIPQSSNTAKSATYLDGFIRLLFALLSLGITEVVLFIYRRFSNSQSGSKEAFAAYVFLILVIGLVASMRETGTPSTLGNQTLSELNSEKDISILLTELKAIPVEQFGRNLELYQKLVELDPSNSLYRAKVSYYAYMLESTKRVSHLSEIQQKEALDILERLRGIPVSEAQLNIDLYSRLLEFDPDNKYYSSKLEKYQSALIE